MHVRKTCIEIAEKYACSCSGSPQASHKDVIASPAALRDVAISRTTVRLRHETPHPQHAVQLGNLVAMADVHEFHPELTKSL